MVVFVLRILKVAVHMSGKRVVMEKHGLMWQRRDMILRYWETVRME